MIAALLVLLVQSPAAPLTGDRSVVSKCEISTDAGYGYSSDTPIRVGGTPVFGASRQKKFLGALAGPGGQPITFVRRGTVWLEREKILIDRYEVRYAGLEKPIELYLDLYRWDPPKAPRGFSCATPIGLLEPIDLDAERRQLMQLAIDAGTRGDVPLVPLGEDGSLRHGGAVDVFRFIAGMARAMAVAGQPVTPATLPQIYSGQVLVIAHPISCDGRTRKPRAIDVRRPDDAELTGQKGVIDTAGLRRMMIWTTVPDGAIGRTFGAEHLPPGGIVVLTYDGPACPSASDTVTLRVASALPEQVVDVEPVWPSGVAAPDSGAPVIVEVQTRIGIDGVPRQIEALSGPREFVQAAIDAVRQWRYKVPTINGAPTYVPVMMTIRLTFTNDGAPCPD